MSLFCSCHGTSPRVQPNTKGVLPVALTVIVLGAILAFWPILTSSDSTARAQPAGIGSVIAGNEGLHSEAPSAVPESLVSSNRRRIETFTCSIARAVGPAVGDCMRGAAERANVWLDEKPTARVLEFRTDLSTALDSVKRDVTVYVITIYYLDTEE